MRRVVVCCGMPGKVLRSINVRMPAFAVAMGVILAGCGGNPGPVVTIYMNGDQSGYVESGSYHAAVHAVEPVVGDVDSDTRGSILRGILQFPIDTIPHAAAVTEAKIVLTQCKVVGNPYGVHGNVFVDHITFTDPFDTSAFDSPAIGATLGVISDNAKLEKKSLTVTTAVQADLAAGRSSTQYRLRMPVFNGPPDTVSNYAVFNTLGLDHILCPSTTSGYPILIVTYH